MSDVDLLRAELGVIWRLDERGRLPGPEDMVIGVAADGMTAAVSRHVPDPLAARLLDVVTRPAPPPSLRPPGTSAATHRDASAPPERPPAALAPREIPAPLLDECRALLGGGLTVSGGPSYLVCPPVRFDAPAAVLRSEDPAHAELVRPLRPGTWEPEEWDELVAGGEGAPWAMIVEDGQVAAICHTARSTPAGAEAGTWTAPASRGRGYAAATTAVWAGLVSGARPMFYSTRADNLSSQRVAARLGLRAIGWLWKLTR
ncbi:GNAT family N-acetyltransferase [Nonomuraea sp. SYSU D8015]|uniref:GNAT family N-acetyltransferase n=1 Tax=Nonomuraea sp. SYSU D8015 TaxID=2593644 RepID=UPI001CB738F5|nr:GNAT family N-acetyltransferase [Nonomuraea sp. SYSU D8015]